MWTTHAAFAWKIVSAVLFVISLSGIYFGTVRGKKDFLTPDALKELKHTQSKRQAI
jgi:hypothetical protein